MPQIGTESELSFSNLSGNHTIIRIKIIDKHLTTYASNRRGSSDLCIKCNSKYKKKSSNTRSLGAYSKLAARSNPLFDCFSSLAMCEEEFDPTLRVWVKASWLEKLLSLRLWLRLSCLAYRKRRSHAFRFLRFVHTTSANVWLSDNLREDANHIIAASSTTL